MKTAFLFGLLFLFKGVHAMDAREVIVSMQKVYSKEAHLEYACTYELFKGSESTSAQTTYKGYIYRNEQQVYQKIDQSEFVYARDFFLRIDHQEQAAAIGGPRRSVNTDVDMSQALKECSKLEMETADGSYIITMHIKNTSSLPFSVITLRIDQKKFYLEQLDVYYSSVQDFSEEPGTKDEAQPHLRISFETPKINPKNKSTYFNTDTYFRTEKQQLAPVGDIAGYSLTDNRIN